MPLKIIYLDDEPDLCQLFKQNFESDEVEIKVFSDPAKALQETLENPPDYVFLDYRLPNTSGDIVAKSIDSKIPKIFITGDLSVNPEADFIKIFNKPFSFDEMESFINNLKKQLS
jgi:DNA-binding NtrC family response regulator